VVDEHRILLKRFWIRKQGLSLDFLRIKTLGELTVAGQLFAALLSNDGARVALLLSRHNMSMWYRELVTLVRKTGLAGVILHNIVECGLRGTTADAYALGVDRKAIDRRAEHFFLKKLRRLAMLETLTSKQIDKHFLRALDALGDLGDRVVWIKGIAAARSVYPRVEYRVHGDADCVVRNENFQQVIERLCEKVGYGAACSSGFCNQIGCGPTAEITDLILSPSNNLTQASPVSLTAPNGAGMIDVKVNPFCRGLPMSEIERFYSQSLTCDWKGRKVRIPTLIDQLIITLLNLVERERFENWRCLYDVHLLVTKINESPKLWQEFLRCARAEGIELTTWAGLALSIDHFNSPVPPPVMQELKPQHTNAALFILAFIVHPEFVWNSSSLPSMCLSSLISTDRKRRYRALWSAFSPSKDFLTQYYCRPKQIPWMICLVLHWLIIVLPGGMVRRTFGPIIWPSKPLSWSGSQEASSIRHL
jgi:hypothetical protein